MAKAAKSKVVQRKHTAKKTGARSRLEVKSAKVSAAVKVKAPVKARRTVKTHSPVKAQVPKKAPAHAPEKVHTPVKAHTPALDLAHGKPTAHHDDTGHFLKSVLVKAAVTILLFIGFDMLNSNYFKNTVFYYRYFKLSDIFFQSLKPDTIPGIMLAIIAVLLSIGIILVARHLYKLSLDKHTKHESVAISLASGGFFASNVMIKLWVRSNYETAISHAGMVRWLNYSTLFIFAVLLAFALFGYTFRGEDGKNRKS